MRRDQQMSTWQPSRSVRAAPKGLQAGRPILLQRRETDEAPNQNGPSATAIECAATRNPGGALWRCAKGLVRSLMRSRSTTFKAREASSSHNERLNRYCRKRIATPNMISDKFPSSSKWKTPGDALRSYRSNANVGCLSVHSLKTVLTPHYCQRPRRRYLCLLRRSSLIERSSRRSPLS